MERHLLVVSLGSSEEGQNLILFLVEMFVGRLLDDFAVVEEGVCPLAQLERYPVVRRNGLNFILEIYFLC